MSRFAALAAWQLMLTMLLAAAVARGDAPAEPADPPPEAELSPAAVTLAEPLAVYFVLADKTLVRGKLLAHDERLLKVRAADGTDRLVGWDKLTPMTAYSTRRRLIDPKDAEAHFRLGWFCWTHGLKQDAAAEFNQAKRLDGDLADRVQSVYDGKYQPPGGEGPADDPPDRPEPAEPKAAPIDNRVGGETDPNKVVKFSKATAEQEKAAVEEARAKAVATVKRLGIDLRLIETRHFLIFTNWPKGEEKWLKEVHEGMYRGLAKQFGISPDENVWYGKMAIYAFDKSDDFNRFAREIDRSGVTGPPVAGYAAASGDGRGHIVIWRHSSRTQLASTIVHEGAHAFLARYRTNRFIVSWLNEGLAQMMEQVGVPNSSELRQARTASAAFARDKRDIRPIFRSAGNIPFDMYPVALTLTDLLLRRSRKSYVNMINDIKDGTEVEAALKKNFGWDYNQLAKLWYKWAEMDWK